MEKLIHGLHQFQDSVVAAQRQHFTALASGHKPDALFITCSDSRINPNEMTQTGPGELFIVRNAGCIIPPYGAVDGAEAATIEYAVRVLGVKHILVCGHSHCGAMTAVATRQDLTQLPALQKWLRHAEPTRKVIEERYAHLEGDGLVWAAVAENVLVQLEHLRGHPVVAEGLAAKEIHLYGWVYQIDSGDVFAFDAEVGQFVPVAHSKAAATRRPVGSV
jgi:carbonic anhydrase